MINEKIQTPSNLRLTDHQKSVLANVIYASTPRIALDTISTGQKTIIARNMLSKLGLIEYDNTGANITDEGMELAKSTGIVDDVGELSQQGKDLLQVVTESYSLLKELNSNINS